MKVILRPVMKLIDGPMLRVAGRVDRDDPPKLDHVPQKACPLRIDLFFVLREAALQVIHRTCRSRRSLHHFLEGTSLAPPHSGRQEYRKTARW